MFQKPKLTKNRIRKKSCEIPVEVRMKVAIRDSGLCIFCHQQGISNAHLVKRSQGGLGIEQNIFTACIQCHFEEDHGKNTKYYENIAEEYLKSKYSNWNREDMIFKKGINK
jgi:5-methylcytosine-specific restriction endonuclease McrA